MIQISVYIFLIILQSLVISLAVIIFLVYRNSKLKELSTAPVPEPEPEAQVQTPDAGAYLASEAEATKLQLSTTAVDSEHEDLRSNPIALRVEYLQLEQMWASNHERDENFWSALGDRMQELLEKFAGQQQADGSTSVLPMDDQDKILSQDLINNQVQTIEALKELIAQADLDAEKSRSLQDSVEQLSQTNLELTHCVAVLEDENGFLRNQVETLVAHKPEEQ